MNCPECGSMWISAEVGPTGTGRLIHLVGSADEGDGVELVRCCWTCGWRETRVVSVDAITAEPGDQQVAARERLLDELCEAASSLDSAELEATLTDMNERSDSDE